MMDLVEFLRSRLEEREFVARANVSRVNPTRGEWTFRADDNGMQVRNDRGHLVVRHTWPDEGEHIALNDPAYVLADIAAKQRIVAGPNGGTGPESHDEWYETLRLLALPFASHPGYDEAWRPCGTPGCGVHRLPVGPAG